MLICAIDATAQTLVRVILQSQTFVLCFYLLWLRLNGIKIMFMYVDSYLTELVSTQFRIEYRSFSVFSMVNKDCMLLKKSVRNKTSAQVSFEWLSSGEHSSNMANAVINHPPFQMRSFSFTTNICDMTSNRLLDRELVDVETSQPVSMGRGDWLQLECISYKDTNNIQRRWERCVRRKERVSNIDGIEM